MNRVTLFWLADGVAAILFAAGLSAFAMAGRVPPLVAAGATALLLAGTLMRAVLPMMADEAGNRAAALVKAARRAPLFGWLLGTSPARHAMLGEVVADMTDRVEDLHGYHARFQPLRRAAVITPLMIAGAVAFASPIAAGILMATLITFGLGMALAGAAAGKAARAQLDSLARLSGLFVDRVRALPAIVGFGAEDRIVRQLGDATSQVAERTIGVLRVAFLSSAVLEFFAALSVALVAVYCGFNLLGLLPFPVPEKLSLAQALFALALAPEFYLPFRRLAAAYHDRQIGLAAEERLDALTSDTASAAPQIAAPAMLKAPPAIRFEEVMIDYDGHAIGPFSFVVPAGQVIAIVGATGIGKSSLLHALLGLAPIGSGHILIDGAPLPDPGLRGAVSWAGQSVALLPESIAANLRVARPDADDAALHRAVALAGLETVISARAGGMESMLNPSGSGLSGGERRRIGLARAYLRDAPLWLLDEPTADLDSAMALDLIGRVLAAAKGRTVLLVTHDDRIAALAHQRITLA